MLIRDGNTGVNAPALEIYPERFSHLIWNYSPEDRGNGFLFRDYDAGGLWHGLSRSVAFHRRPPVIREAQIRRIMREVRRKHSVDQMVDGYMNAYQRLNGGVPLT